MARTIMIDSSGILHSYSYSGLPGYKKPSIRAMPYGRWRCIGPHLMHCSNERIGATLEEAFRRWSEYQSAMFETLLEQQGPRVAHYMYEPNRVGNL